MALKINTNIQNDTGFVVESDQVGVNGNSLDEVVTGFASEVTNIETDLNALSNEVDTKADDTYEEWTFELKDGTEVTKQVIIKETSNAV